MYTPFFLGQDSCLDHSLHVYIAFMGKSVLTTIAGTGTNYNVVSRKIT